MRNRQAGIVRVMSLQVKQSLMRRLLLHDLQDTRCAHVSGDLKFAQTHPMYAEVAWLAATALKCFCTTGGSTALEALLA